MAEVDEFKPTAKSRLTMFLVILFFVGGGLLGLGTIVWSSIFGQATVPSCSSDEVTGVLEKLFRNQSTQLAKARILFEATATLSENGTVRECRTDVRVTEAAGLQWTQTVAYQVVLADDKKQFLVQISNVGRPSTDKQPTVAPVTEAVAPQESATKPVVPRQLQVTVLDVGTCQGVEDATCLQTDKGIFATRSDALSGEQKALLAAALEQKKAACLVNVIFHADGTKAFDGVLEKCQ